MKLKTVIIAALLIIAYICFVMIITTVLSNDPAVWDEDEIQAQTAMEYNEKRMAKKLERAQRKQKRIHKQILEEAKRKRRKTNAAEC